MVQRRALIERKHIKLSTSRQCRLLGVGRSTYYYQPKGTSALDLELMALIDRQYLKTPFYGSRKMAEWLERILQYPVNRKRVQRLMRLMGIEAIYQKPNTSRPAQGQRIYPYLLKGLEIDRPGMVFAADITYIPMRRGFLYLVAVMDWFSRYVLAWRLSNTLDVHFCLEALKEALGKGSPYIFNTRPGRSIHQHQIYRHAIGARNQNQHGWQGPFHGQHLRGEALAQPEIRGSVPQGI